MRYFRDNILIGNKDDAESLTQLKGWLVCVTLNVCSDLAAPYHPGITQFKVGLDDPKTGLAPNNPLEEAVEVLEMARALAKKRGGNVLIHCHAGHNRSALIAALWAKKYKFRRLKSMVKLAQVKDNKPWMKAFGLEW